MRAPQAQLATQERLKDTMSKPIRRAIPCGTYLSDRRSDDPQSDGEPPSDVDTPQSSDKGDALRTLAAAGAAMSAGAVPRLFGAATRREPFRLANIDDVAEAFASGIPLTGEEIARAYRIWRAEMKARGWPLDLYSRRRREDEPLQ